MSKLKAATSANHELKKYYADVLGVNKLRDSFIAPYQQILNDLKKPIFDQIQSYQDIFKTASSLSFFNSSYEETRRIFLENVKTLHRITTPNKLSKEFYNLFNEQARDVVDSFSEAYQLGEFEDFEEEFPKYLSIIYCHFLY